jgi:heme oxygenase
MANLYEINKELLNCIDLETGEIIDTESFDKLQIEKNDKLENVALWYKNLQSEAQSYKAEETIFAEKRKRAENKAESLKKYLDIELQGNKFNTVKVDITYRKSTSVNVLDVNTLPEKYRKTVTTVSADKVNIAKALKVGEVVTGAELVESNNIQIN